MATLGRRMHSTVPLARALMQRVPRVKVGRLYTTIFWNRNRNPTRSWHRANRGGDSEDSSATWDSKLPRRTLGVHLRFAAVIYSRRIKSHELITASRPIRAPLRSIADSLRSKLSTSNLHFCERQYFLFPCNALLPVFAMIILPCYFNVFLLFISDISRRLICYACAFTG